MHSQRNTARRLVGLFIFLIGASCLPMQAQNVAKANADAIRLMKEEKWAEAYPLLVRVTDAYEGRAMKLFGPRFGWFWYFRGYTGLKLNKYEDAMASFEKCYKDYKNVRAKRDEEASKNFYNKKALLMWGHAAKGAEEWKIALQMYDKFLKERDPTRDTDSYDRGVFYINSAICNYKLKNISEGNKHLETAIKGKVTFPTPNKGIMSAFNVMVETVIEKKDEKALLDFISKNRAHIALEPFEAHEFSRLFMKLAGDAKEADMIRSTFELYSLVPSTVGTIDNIQARLSTLGSFDRTIRDGSMIVKKSDLSEDLTALKQESATGKVNEIYAYLNTAVLQEENGNTRGAFAVYEQLELYFPKAKILKEVDNKFVAVPARERNLFNLVRTAAVIGEVFKTEQYGAVFLEDFPDSSYVEEVRRLMLTSLFFNGEYENCIKVAEKMLPKLTEPSKEHDICLFVLGGSKHYTGSFVEAQPLLDDYISQYAKEEGDKTRIQAALYFQAANQSRLQEWERSAALLDAFFKKYPDPKSNIYFPFALYDRANCHYSLTEYEPALEKVTRVEKEFAGTSIMESNLALKGNILQSLDQFEEAEVYYIKALELAEQKKNDLVASECLFYLTALVGQEKIGQKENPRVAEAVPYYQKFWDRYGENSPFRARVAVAGIPAMAAAGKREEALENLQAVIADLAKSGISSNLEEAIGSYTDAYLESKTPEELKDHYYDFPRIDSRDKATRALLRIAIIDVFEKVIEQTDPNEEPKKVRDARAMIDVLFNELRTDFDPADLSNFILVKVGDFIRGTKSPQNAKPYYEAALANKDDKSHQTKALFGLADVLGRGGNEMKKEAIALLKKVRADSEDAGDREEALYLIARINFERENYAKAAETALEYINQASYRRFKLPARVILAESYDAAGKVEDAMGIYLQIWGPNMGAIRYSAPAMNRWMELVWDRNGTNKSGKSDRQFAYEKGYGYIDLTQNLLPKMTLEEKDLWNEVKDRVADYEARGVEAITQEAKN